MKSKTGTVQRWTIWDAGMFGGQFKTAKIDLGTAQHPIFCDSVSGQVPFYAFLVPDNTLDISYSKAPSWIKVIPAYEHDQHTTFSALSTLAFPEGRAEYAGEPLASPVRQLKLPPDEQMLCYDYLYYVCANQVCSFPIRFRISS